MHRPFALTVIMLVTYAQVLQFLDKVEREDGKFVVFGGNGKGRRKIFRNPIDRRNFFLKLLTALFDGSTFAIGLRVNAYVLEAGMHGFRKIVHAAIEHKRGYSLIF